MNNLNSLLDLLKQQQQKKLMENSYIEAYPSLSFDFINKHPLLKSLILWFQQLGNDGGINKDKHGFLIGFIDAITNNLTKSRNHFRYSDTIKNFALSLYILGGKSTYEFIRLNLPGSFPSVTILNRLISNANAKISEAEFRFSQLQKHFDDHNLQYAFGSEDATSIIKKIKYDSTTNTFNGFPTPLDRGVPIKEYYRADSFDKLKSWFDSDDKSSLLNVHMIQPVPPTNQNIIPSPFLLSAYGIDNTVLLVKQKQLPPHVLHVHTFSSQACESIFRNTRALSGIYTTIVNFTVHDFLRRAQRLFLLNDIKFKQLNDDPVNNFVFPVHHKHRKDRQSSFTQSQSDIDQIDIEQIITDAYHEAVDMLDRLEILNLLKEKRALCLNLLSEYMFKQLNSNSKMYDYSSQLSNIDDEEFELADDDDDDDDERADDLSMDDGNNDSTSSNDDHTDDDEQYDTRNLINTTKDDYVGIKIFNAIQTHIEHSYFEVTINDDMKYMHKETACWLLTGEKSKISNDRLLRVQQTNKKSDFFLLYVPFS
ncbi:unnamed protein product [Rotaria socialis]